MLQYAAASNEPESISTVRGVDGTSRDNNSPSDIADAFQVRSHSDEPIFANRCRNLFSHDESGPAGTGEAEKVWPKVPRISSSGTFACDGERLARARGRPDLTVFRPAGKSGSDGPASNACEEMALPIPGKVIWVNIGDAPFVNVAGGDDSASDQAAQPCSSTRIKLVVVVRLRHAGSKNEKARGCGRRALVEVGQAA